MGFSKLLVVSGLIILILAGLLFWQRYNPQRLSFDINELSGQTEDITALPLEIIIPSLNIDLPIIPAKLQKGKWEATTKGVSYLSSSPIPGEAGNSILYGHNWPNLLGNITKLKPGQVIRIKFMDGSEKKFVIDSTITISPKDVGILNPSKSAQITLYTCTGFFDSKRFVVVAKEQIGS